MSQSDTRSTKVLFREWRGGDPEAGQIMAQRFADWYYAISTSRLGEKRGSDPCDAACASFGQGAMQITESRNLVPWAHKIIQDQLESAGSRVTDGDEPNAFTGNKRPKGLLVQARAALPDEIGLLEATYGGTHSDEELERLSVDAGGHPLGALRARYRVKKWLRDQAGVPFEVVPDDPILDRAPLPLYESGRMATPEEEVGFEQWMISDIDLCRDIAEFAHFAIALRGGLPADYPTSAQTQTQTQTQTQYSQDEASGGGAGKVAAAAGAGALVLGGGALALIIAVGLAVYFLVL